MNIKSPRKIFAVLLFVFFSGQLSIFAQYYPGGISNSNLKIWLDAADASTLTIASSKVSQWNDKSGTGVNVSQGTAALRPAYATNQINGLPAVQTNGTSTYLSGTFAVDGLTQMSMLCAATPATNNASGSNPYAVNFPIFYWGMETGGWGQIGMELNTMNTGFYGYGWRFGTSQGAADVLYSPSPAPSGAKVMAAAHNNTVERGYYNGFNITSPSSGSLTGKLASIMNTPNTFGIGTGQTAYGGNGYGGNNKTGEILIYNTSLNNTQLILLQNYLAAKWGVTLTANSKFTPPTATTYNHNLVGIGRESGTDTVVFTQRTKGMGFRSGVATTDFLRDAGDYICAANSSSLAVNLANTNLPSGTLQRWADEWYVRKTDVSNNGGALNIFFSCSAYGLGGLLGTASDYRLLFRSTTGATTYSVITATATVSGGTVSFAMNASAIANGYYTLGTITPTFSPLPVELLYFTGNICNKQVCLNWKTASENNNDHYEIERSSDGIKFEHVRSIAAAGTGNSSGSNEYAAIDEKPYSGLSYYRLKQIDKNYAFDYSDLAAVNFEDDSFVSVYPNPVSDQLNIDVSDDYMNAALTITDAFGNKMYALKLNSPATQINLSQFSAGIYFVVLDNGAGVKSLKISVQR